MHILPQPYPSHVTGQVACPSLASVGPSRTELQCGAASAGRVHLAAALSLVVTGNAICLSITPNKINKVPATKVLGPRVQVGERGAKQTNN